MNGSYIEINTVEGRTLRGSYRSPVTQVNSVLLIRPDNKKGESHTRTIAATSIYFDGGIWLAQFNDVSGEYTALVMGRNVCPPGEFFLASKRVEFEAHHIVTIMSADCKSAHGAYGRPTRSVDSVTIHDLTTGTQIPANTITNTPDAGSGGASGTWKADYPLQPDPVLVVAVGNDGAVATAQKTCP